MGLREWLALDTDLDTTVADIESLLIESGASDINKKYDGGRLVAVYFSMRTDNKLIPFQLPVNIEAVERSLRRDSRRIRPRSDEEKKLADKAELTAWAGIFKWLEAQMIMVKIEQVSMIEVFLPYVYNMQTKQTFFKQLEAQKFQQLPQLPAGK